MTEPVTISQYPHGFLGLLAAQPFVLFPLVIVVVVVFLVIVDRLINVMTHGKRRLMVDPLLYMSITVMLAVIVIGIGVISVDSVKKLNNFDTVSNAYGITISKNHDIMRVLQPGATVVGAPLDSTPITFTDGDGKPQTGVLVRKGDKVTVYNNAANRLTPLKRATR